MKNEEDIKKIFDEWDKSLTADMKRHWNKNNDHPEQRQHDSDMHSRFWFARDVIRHIRARILEYEMREDDLRLATSQVNEVLYMTSHDPIVDLALSVRAILTVIKDQSVEIESLTHQVDALQKEKNIASVPNSDGEIRCTLVNKIKTTAIHSFGGKRDAKYSVSMKVEKKESC